MQEAGGSCSLNAFYNLHNARGVYLDTPPHQRWCIIYLSMNEATFMINTESIIKHNKMIPDRSQPNKKPGAYVPRLLVIYLFIPKCQTRVSKIM